MSPQLLFLQAGNTQEFDRGYLIALHKFEEGLRPVESADENPSESAHNHIGLLDTSVVGLASKASTLSGVAPFTAAFSTAPPRKSKLATSAGVYICLCSVHWVQHSVTDET